MILSLKAKKFVFKINDPTTNTDKESMTPT